MSKKKTHEEYVKQVYAISPNIEVLGQYIDDGTSILHKCKIDGYEWSTKPNNILHGCRCPMCANKSKSNKLTKTQEQYEVELAILCPTIKLIGGYKGASKKAIHECLVCGHQWGAMPSNFIHHQYGCPVCGGQVIGGPPEYKNSIWASEYQEYYSKYLTESQMKMFTPHSGEYVTIACPDCGTNRKIQISQMTSHGFSCVCGDGQSFPNKFVYNVLCQLNLHVKPEYSPDWAGRFRYDDYLVDYNIIIENHGPQHYRDDMIFCRSLEEEQANDKLKYALAIENGIVEYIVIDCQKTTREYIKQSIMNSKLPSILNFAVTDINWLQAQAFATKSLVRVAANLFNNGLSIKDIEKELQKDNSTIRKWLKNATQLGWCNYIAKPQKRSVYCVELNQIYSTIKQASESLNVSYPSIIYACTGFYLHAGRHPKTNEQLSWLYIEDAIEQGYVS